MSAQTISDERETKLVMPAVRERLDLESLDRVHWLGIGLAVITGVIHLGLGLGAPTTPTGAASILAGVGYAVAIVLVLFGARRRLVVALGIPYVASQIILWYVINQPATLRDVSPAAMVDKPVQVILIAICVVIVVRATGEGGINSS